MELLCRECHGEQKVRTVQSMGVSASPSVSLSEEFVVVDRRCPSNLLQDRHVECERHVQLESMIEALLLEANSDAIDSDSTSSVLEPLCRECRSKLFSLLDLEITELQDIRQTYERFNQHVTNEHIFQQVADEHINQQLCNQQITATEHTNQQIATVDHSNKHVTSEHYFQQQCYLQQEALDQQQPLVLETGTGGTANNHFAAKNDEEQAFLRQQRLQQLQESECTLRNQVIDLQLTRDVLAESKKLMEDEQSRLNREDTKYWLLFNTHKLTVELRTTMWQRITLKNMLTCHEVERLLVSADDATTTTAHNSSTTVEQDSKKGQQVEQQSLQHHQSQHQQHYHASQLHHQHQHHHSSQHHLSASAPTSSSSRRLDSHLDPLGATKTLQYSSILSFIFTIDLQVPCINQLCFQIGNKQQTWDEINAAFGVTCLLLSILRRPLHASRFNILESGSRSMITLDIHKRYPIFFTSNREAAQFNQGLQILVMCIKELYNSNSGNNDNSDNREPYIMDHEKMLVYAKVKKPKAVVVNEKESGTPQSSKHHGETIAVKQGFSFRYIPNQNNYDEWAFAVSLLLRNVKHCMKHYKK